MNVIFIVYQEYIRPRAERVKKSPSCCFLRVLLMRYLFSNDVQSYLKNVCLFVLYLRRREELALNIDLAPTFLDIAGAKPNKIMDGTSLMDVAVGTIYNSINGFVFPFIYNL